MDKQRVFFCGNYLIEKREKSQIKKKAKAGDVKSMLDLARYYYANKKIKKTIKYADLAALRQDSYTQYEVGIFYFQLEIHYKAVFWLTIAAKNGDLDAIEDIKSIYNINLNFSNNFKDAA